MANDEVITLAHGDGGKLYHELVEQVFLPIFDNPYLREMTDSAVCDFSGKKMALTTDSFVVRPRFFPGGDIGRLAVCGTVNDLSMSGADPKYLTVGMIIEAGFTIEELQRICQSMADAAREAGVLLVTGDTKVVEQGACDGIFINTAGVGFFDQVHRPVKRELAPGDVIISSGVLGMHGLAVLAAREELKFDPEIRSDVNPLNQLVKALLVAVPEVHALQDPTRGGAATLLNEWAAACSCEIIIEEEKLPSSSQIAGVSRVLGMDPLYLANEGKFIAAVPKQYAEAAVSVLRQYPLGADAAVVGLVTDQNQGRVVMKNLLGVRKIVDPLFRNQLPRIC